MRAGGTWRAAGHPVLVYVDADPALRRLADTTFRGEYVVEAAATIDDMHVEVDPAVAVINLSDTPDPRPVWHRLTERWPMVPAVVVLTTEAAIEHGREAFWALGPASMVVNPYSPDALRRGVATALAQPSPTP